MRGALAGWALWLGLAGCLPEFPEMGDLSEDPNHDWDDDGWEEGAGVCGASDCDDQDPDLHPGAADVPGDGVDANCDCVCEFDADGDGHAALGAPAPGPRDTWICLAFDDCDDGDAFVFPGAVELGGDGIDDDCDGRIDEGTDLDLERSAALVVHGKQANAWAADTLAVDAFGNLVVGAKHGKPLTGVIEAGLVYVVQRAVLAAAVAADHAEPVYLEDLGDHRYDGLDKNDHAGTSLGALQGDLGAVVIGAPDRDPGGADLAGAVYYDREVPEGDLVQSLGDADTIVQGVAAGDNLGDELAVGDFDGDGMSDLAVAAPRYGEDAGGVYLLFDLDHKGTYSVDDDIFAPSFVDGAVALTASGGNYGEGLAVLDADVDGYDDLAVASPKADLVHLWLGGDDGPAFGGLPDAEWLGPEATPGETGFTMAAVDWDGDAKPELAISARGADGTTVGATNDGELYLVSYDDTGGGSLVNDPGRVSTCRFLGVAGKGEFGHGVARLGDLDGDDKDELLVAARSASIVYLVLGGEPCVDVSIDDAATWRWIYEEASDDDMSFAGHALVGLGDLDGGGKDDFVIGQYGADVPIVTLPDISGGTDAGAFYVLLGEDLLP